MSTRMSPAVALAGISGQPVALTMGDPAGIGIEITLRAWLAREREQLAPFAMIADPEAVEARARDLSLRVPIATVSRVGAATNCFPSALPILPVHVRTRARPGAPDAANAAAIISSIEIATAAVYAGEACAIVTNPIAKHVLYSAGFAHPGHTEFLASLAERQRPGQRLHPVMMLACETLRVVPLTVHIPLADVPRAITGSLICETVRIVAQALIRDFGILAPRISVAGLNPHAGEDGSIGREDKDVISPALAALAAEGLQIRGPLSADTLFHREAREGYDAVIAMYHDQALIPIKTLAFDEAVNITLGLPFVRTSPDHGTAFDIAARGIASPRSLIAALRVAHNMAARRAVR